MTDQQLTFKQADPAQNTELLYEMDIATFTRDYDYPSVSEAATLEYLKDSQVYLAYVKDAPVGTFSFREVDGEVEVRQLLVLPRFQRHGYGRALLDKVLSLNAGKSLWLVTHPRNQGALLLYIKNGFIIYAYKENYYGDGQPRVLLRYAGT